MRALVVVPTYNEIATLGRVVEQALAVDAGLELLVVDDSSPDGTGQLADRLAEEHDRVFVLHRTRKEGLGSAYRAGFAWGLARGFDVICEMDADCSHDPADLGRLVAATEGADLVIGSRYVPHGAVQNWPLHRRVLSVSGNRYVQMATGMPLRDATAGFRAFRREVLEALDLGTVRSDGYSFQLEMALRTWRLGFRIVEIPIVFTERTEGASKISRGIVVEALWRVPLWGLPGPRRATRVHPDSVAARTPLDGVRRPRPTAGT